MKINKIYNESCMDTMQKMPDNFLDATVTSPPYDNLRTYKDGVGDEWSFKVFKPIAQELYRTTKEGGVVVWVVGDATIDGSETGSSFKQALYFKELGFKKSVENLVDDFQRNSMIFYSHDIEYTIP